MRYTYISVILTVFAITFEAFSDIHYLPCVILKTPYKIIGLMTPKLLTCISIVYNLYCLLKA